MWRLIVEPWAAIERSSSFAATACPTGSGEPDSHRVAVNGFSRQCDQPQLHGGNQSHECHTDSTLPVVGGFADHDTDLPVAAAGRSIQRYALDLQLTG